MVLPRNVAFQNASVHGPVSTPDDFTIAYVAQCGHENQILYPVMVTRRTTERAHVTAGGGS